MPVSFLLCHPASPAPSSTALKVESALRADGLHLRYTLQGDASAWRIPAAAAAEFADELWRHTCFEAFVATDADAGYREFNFSPSGQWAAYAFLDYRERLAGWTPLTAPSLEARHDEQGLILDALVPRALLPEAPVLHIGLTAVLEAADGSLSYWALTHTAPRPDFHPRAAFTQRLATDTLLP